MKLTRSVVVAGLTVTVLVLLSACASRPMGHPGDPAFVRGLIDGFLAPISFVISLFNDHVRMYAFPNVGRWYDLGFMIGIGAWGGGAATTKYVYIDRVKK